MNILSRFCPECNKILFYKCQKSFNLALDKNGICASCAKKGNRHPNFGKSPWNKGKKNSQIPWHKGKTNVYSKESLKKMSDAKKGKKMPLEIREKISKSNLGKHNRKSTDDEKRKMRICAAEEFSRTGRKRRIDSGFFEWLEKKKKEGYNFKSDFYIKDLGYFVDGYDAEKHIIVEYDTKYHNNISQQNRDKIRQENIIEYYKNIGKPLKSFWRVNLVDNEKIIMYE